MIKSFNHKGLEEFFTTGSTRGIQVQHAKKLDTILTALDRVKYTEDLNLYTFNLHKLKGKLKDLWSIKVNGNWRITFKFEDENVYIVDYVDYH